jgi:MarR family transcriptional regulator, temperature-dependent positive regulator of motility
MREKSARRLRLQQNDEIVAESPGLEDGAEMLSRQRLDAFTHARLWKNPCGFAARFNYLALRYNVPLYGWVKDRFDLSRIEFVVIYSLAIQDGVTASEIASSTAFPKNTLSRAVNRLIGLGYVARRIDGDDRRSQILTLTEAGRAVVEEAMPRFAGLEQEMLAPLSLVEREMLSMLLAKVVLAMFHGESQTEDGALPSAEEM